MSNRLKFWFATWRESLRRLTGRASKVIELALAFVGAAITLAEAAEEVFGNRALFELYRRHFWPLLAIVLCVSVVVRRDRLEFSCRLSQSRDVTVTLKVCDVLSIPGAVIVPTNSTFDTCIDDEFISPDSVQGQYQARYFGKALVQLDRMIEEGLKDVPYSELRDGRGTNRRRYPIGTVCRISGMGKKAYLVADSDVGANGIPVGVDANNVQMALAGLWEVLASAGNRETYSTPLICTGKAGATGVTRDEVIMATVDTFLDAIAKSKFTERLIICIHPDDFRKVDWDRLCRYVEYKCEFPEMGEGQ